MKDFFKKIKEMRKEEPTWEKTICIECINRMEKMYNFLNKEERKKKVKLRKNINKLLKLLPTIETNLKCYDK